MRAGYADSMLLASLILAAGTDRGDQDAGGGLSVLIIVIVVLAIVAAMAVLFAVLHRGSKASRGGVEPKRGEFRPGDPPFESLRRRR